jgi:hypothetical protein
MSFSCAIGAYRIQDGLLGKGKHEWDRADEMTELGSRVEWKLVPKERIERFGALGGMVRLGCRPSYFQRCSSCGGLFRTGGRRKGTGGCVWCRVGGQAPRRR